MTEGPSAESQKSLSGFFITEIKYINHNVMFISVEPHGRDKVWYTPSCFAFIKVEGTDIFKKYTPISPPGSPFVHFAIKIYEKGLFSNYIRNRRVGETLWMQLPVSKRRYVENEFETVAMIAGGTGITPMIQILECRSVSSSDRTNFRLVFCNRTKEDIFLQDMLERYGEFCSTTYLNDSEAKRLDDGGNGCTENASAVTALTASVLEKVCKGKDGKPADFIFVCGPPGMMEFVCGQKDLGNQGRLCGLLKDIGFTEDKVYKF